MGQGPKKTVQIRSVPGFVHAGNVGNKAPRKKQPLPQERQKTARQIAYEQLAEHQRDNRTRQRQGHYR